MFDLFHLISSTKIYDNERDEDQDIFLYMCISKWLINLNSFKIVSIYNNQNVDFKVSILRILIHFGPYLKFKTLFLHSNENWLVILNFSYNNYSKKFSLLKTASTRYNISVVMMIDFLSIISWKDCQLTIII